MGARAFPVSQQEQVPHLDSFWPFKKKPLIRIINTAVLNQLFLANMAAVEKKTVIENSK